MRQLILTFDGGGLCNRLFPFANALAAGWEHGFQIVNPVFGEYRDYFRGPTTPETPLKLNGCDYIRPAYTAKFWSLRKRISAKFGSKSFVRVPETQALDIDALLAKQRGQVWVEALYCLAIHSFTKHAAALRQYFQPVEQVENEVRACIGEARNGTDVLIGAHIRQGDYKHHDNGMLYYDTAEYASVMEKIDRLFPDQNVRFLICSNVPQDPDLLREIDWRSGPGSEITDLYALAECDYMLGAPSSYTQWASFFGEVPRFVHNRKYEERSGQARTETALNSFAVHRSGFGRFTKH